MCCIYLGGGGLGVWIIGYQACLVYKYIFIEKLLYTKLLYVCFFYYYYFAGGFFGGGGGGFRGVGGLDTTYLLYINVYSLRNLNTPNYY